MFHMFADRQRSVCKLKCSHVCDAGLPLCLNKCKVAKKAAKCLHSRRSIARQTRRKRNMSFACEGNRCASSLSGG